MHCHAALLAIGVPGVVPPPAPLAPLRPCDIGLITPYAGQLRELRRAVRPILDHYASVTATAAAAGNAAGGTAAWQRGPGGPPAAVRVLTGEEETSAGAGDDEGPGEGPGDLEIKTVDGYQVRTCCLPPLSLAATAALFLARDASLLASRCCVFECKQAFSWTMSWLTKRCTGSCAGGVHRSVVALPPPGARERGHRLLDRTLQPPRQRRVPWRSAARLCMGWLSCSTCPVSADRPALMP